MLNAINTAIRLYPMEMRIPKIKYGPKYTTISCSIRGVPRIMEMYADTIPLITGFLDILPKQISSPRGSENTSVTTKISTDTTIPPASCWSITLKDLSFPPEKFFSCTVRKEGAHKMYPLFLFIIRKGFILSSCMFYSAFVSSAVSSAFSSEASSAVSSSAASSFSASSSPMQSISATSYFSASLSTSPAS